MYDYILLTLALAAAALATDRLFSALNMRLMRRRVADLEARVLGLETHVATLTAFTLPRAHEPGKPVSVADIDRGRGEVTFVGGGVEPDTLAREALAQLAARSTPGAPLRNRDDYIAAHAACEALKACRAEHGTIQGVGTRTRTCPRCGWVHVPGDHMVRRETDEDQARCNVCGQWWGVVQL